MDDADGGAARKRPKPGAGAGADAGGEAGTEAGTEAGPGAPVDYPAQGSAGFLIRQAHNAFQRRLEQGLAPHGVPRGHWYFLRALWEEDGLTQRELSARVGTTEPTTMVALRGMEAAGLVARTRDTADRRRVHVALTDKGRGLRDTLLPVARAVNEDALDGFTEAEAETLRRLLARAAGTLKGKE